MQIRHDSNRRSPLRMALPTCPRCHDAVTSVVLRTGPALYCQCLSCNQLWSEQRPAGDAQSQQKQSA